MTCHITGGFSLPEGAQERSIQLFADDRVAQGHLIGQILQMWRRSQQQSSNLDSWPSAQGCHISGYWLYWFLVRRHAAKPAELKNSAPQTHLWEDLNLEQARLRSPSLGDAQASIDWRHMKKRECSKEMTLALSYSSNANGGDGSRRLPRSKVGIYPLLRNPIPITNRCADTPISTSTSVKLNYCPSIYHLLPTFVQRYPIRWHLYFCPFARSVPRDTGLASEASGASRLSCGRVCV